MMDETYKVKLIGKTYEIDKKILIKIPIFRTMLEDFSDNKSKILSINRSSLLFDHVIAYIIDDTYPYPLKYFTELDFYDVIYDKSKLYDPHKNSNDKLELLSKNVSEINNLTIKIYELENKIYSLESKLHNNIGNICYNDIYDKKCKILNCNNISGYDLFCIEHKKIFKDKCCYNSPDTEKYCFKITDDNFKYCINHTEFGHFCNNKYCQKERIKNNKFCIIHS